MRFATHEGHSRPGFEAEKVHRLALLGEGGGGCGDHGSLAHMPPRLPTPQMLHVGSRLWGVVVEVSHRGLIVSLPHGLKGYVSPADAGAGTEGQADLLDLFTIGQLVAAQVTRLSGAQGDGFTAVGGEQGETKEKKKIFLSLTPIVINAGMGTCVCGGAHARVCVGVRVPAGCMQRMSGERCRASAPVLWLMPGSRCCFYSAPGPGPRRRSLAPPQPQRAVRHAVAVRMPCTRWHRPLRPALQMRARW